MWQQQSKAIGFCLLFRRFLHVYVVWKNSFFHKKIPTLPKIKEILSCSVKRKQQTNTCLLLLNFLGRVEVPIPREQQKLPPLLLLFVLGNPCYCDVPVVDWTSLPKTGHSSPCIRTLKRRTVSSHYYSFFPSTTLKKVPADVPPRLLCQKPSDWYKEMSAGSESKK